MIRLCILCFLFLFSLAFSPVASAGVEWTEETPRAEISPQFTRTGETLSLRAPEKEGIHGWFQSRIPVEGGSLVRLSVERLAENVPFPRRSCSVRIEWEGDQGKVVKSPHPVNPVYFGKSEGSAKPDFPRDRSTDEDGWVLVSDDFKVPNDATTAVVQLHLRWAPGGELKWRNFSFEKIERLEKRLVTLAAVHLNLQGSGRSVEENRELFAPLIKDAASREADLVVLPELLTCKGVTHDYVSVAEPVPGPTTDYFGALAKQHDCYLVVGLPERSGHLVYNVAALIGPNGKLVGKYRKVTLPREEIQRGISPGSEYPVFDTRFGKVGMMICYDVFFPEVARELAMKGAEVLALPIWGGNPRLAAARCAENGVYLVSSTYTDHDFHWMKSAVWNREGDRLVEGTKWGTVVTATVDLNERTYWYGLGDFQSRIAREAPVRKAESAVPSRRKGPTDTVSGK